MTPSLRNARAGAATTRPRGEPRLLPEWERDIRSLQMRVISRRVLRDFWQAGHGEAEQPLRAWFAEVSHANWKSMADIKRRYPHASVIDAERVVFNIGGNKFRLVVEVWFPGQAVWIKFLGSHRRYDRIDVSRL